MNLSFESAGTADVAFLLAHDRHISEPVLRRKIRENEIRMIRNGTCTIGWMRWNLFWDNTPFLNMLSLLEPYRRQGAGTLAMLFWEQLMIRNGYSRIMTSTLSNEEAQHFYRKLGFRDAGVLLLPGEPAELLFIKDLQQKGSIE